MKKLLVSFALTAFMCLFSVLSFAQSEEGVITIEITEVGSDNQQLAAQMEMMKGSQVTVSFKDGASLTSMNMMGGMVETDVLTSAEGDMDMLMSMMGQKIWIQATKAELELSQAQDDSGMNDLDVEYDESDTKTILGFECYKMIATNPAMEDFLIEAYITEELQINAAMIRGVDLEQFRGTPLEYVVSTPIPQMGGGLSMTFSAQDYVESVDDAVFELDTDGYTQMSWDEFIDGIGGNFGF